MTAITDRLPHNEFSNDLEYMASMDTAYHNVLKLERESETFRTLRNRTMVNESNAMSEKSDWQIKFEEYLQRLELNKGK